MLDNCAYNRIKLLHDLSKISWFIEKCCDQDSAACAHDDCKQTIARAQKDLDALIDFLHKGGA